MVFSLSAFLSFQIPPFLSSAIQVLFPWDAVPLIYRMSYNEYFFCVVVQYSQIGIIMMYVCEFK